MRLNSIVRGFVAGWAGCAVWATASAKGSAPDHPIHTPRVTTTPLKTVGNAASRQVTGTSCPQDIATHTDAAFAGVIDAIVFGGLFEGETVAASYNVDAAAFPLTVDAVEAVFGTFLASVETTTHWSVLVWQGTPDSGTLLATISSDGFLFPHLVIPSGSNLVTLHVEPLVPIVVPDDGSHTFSIGIRIDQHNQPPADPCDTPSNCCNAFPTVDTSGVSAPGENWLMGMDCGFVSCPPNGGWADFDNLVFCSISGDWIVRALWTPVECVGACCLPDGGCQENIAAQCAGLGGSFEGVGVPCGAVICPTEQEACCFDNGMCLDLEAGCCSSAGGVPVGAGSSCNDAGCPAALGACCFSGGFCLQLTADDCAGAMGAYRGDGALCSDQDASGIADVCEACLGDFTGDGAVDAADLAVLLGAWGQCRF